MTWEKVKISDVCDVTGGTTPSTTNPNYWDGDIIWLSPVDLPEVGTIVNVGDSKRKITPAALADCSLRVLPKGSVVYSTRASIGKIGLVASPLVTNQGFTNMIPGPRINNRYLAYTLKRFTPQIEALGNTTTFKEVSRTVVKNFEIPLPPLEVQRQIADTLDKADALRRKDQELLQKYDELAQSIFYDMFGDPVRNESGWEATTMGELCDNFKYGTNQKSEDIPAQGSVPVIRIPNVLRDVVNLDNLKYSVLSNKELTDVQLRNGDLLFVRTNGNPEYIGRCAVFTHNFTAAYASYLIRARLSPEARVLPQFVQSVFSTKSARNEFMKRATTTAGNYNINTQSIKSLPVIVPPLDLQQSYLAAYQKVMKMKAVSVQNLMYSENLFNQHLTSVFDN